MAINRALAKADGYSDQEIDEFERQQQVAVAPALPTGSQLLQQQGTNGQQILSSTTGSTQQQSAPPTAPLVPNASEDYSTGRKIMGFAGNVLKGITDPFVQTGKNIGGAAFEVARAGGTALGKKDLYVDPQTGQTIQNPFLSEKELSLFSTDPKKALAHQAANSAQIAAWAIPFGKAVPAAQGIANPVLRTAANVATKAALPGGAAAAVFAGAEEAKKDKNENIIPAAIEAFPKGAALAVLLYGAGQGLKKLSGRGQPVGENKIEQIGDTIRDSSRKITEKPSIYGASNEKEINQTLDKLGIHGRPQQQYEQLLPKMQDLSDDIDRSLRANPQNVPLATIKKKLMENLKDQLRQRELDTPQAQKAIDGYLRDLGIGNTPTGKISTPDLFKVKVDINGDYQRVQDLIEKGMPLNPTQKVMSATRKTVDNIIAFLHPDVKEATLMQSHLFDAAPSLARARINPPTLRAPLGFSIPGVVTQTAADAAGRTLQGVGKGAGAIGNVTGKALGGIGSIAANPSVMKAAVIGNAAAQTQQPQQSLPDKPSLVPQAQAASGVPDISQNPLNTVQTAPNLTTPTGGYANDKLLAAYNQAIQTGNTAAANQILEIAKAQKLLAPAEKPQAVNQTATSGLNELKTYVKELGLDSPQGEFSRTKAIIDQHSPGTSIRQSAEKKILLALSQLKGLGRTPPKYYLDELRNAYIPNAFDDTETARYKLQSLQEQFNNFYYAKPTDQLLESIQDASISSIGE